MHPALLIRVLIDSEKVQIQAASQLNYIPALAKIASICGADLKIRVA